MVGAASRARTLRAATRTSCRASSASGSRTSRALMLRCKIIASRRAGVDGGRRLAAGDRSSTKCCAKIDDQRVRDLAAVHHPRPDDGLPGLATTSSYLYRGHGRRGGLSRGRVIRAIEAPGTPSCPAIVDPGRRSDEALGRGRGQARPRRRPAGSPGAAALRRVLPVRLHGRALETIPAAVHRSSADRAASKLPACKEFDSIRSEERSARSSPPARNRGRLTANVPPRAMPAPSTPVYLPYAVAAPFADPADHLIVPDPGAGRAGVRQSAQGSGPWNVYSSRCTDDDRDDLSLLAGRPPGFRGSGNALAAAIGRVMDVGADPARSSGASISTGR